MKPTIRLNVERLEDRLVMDAGVSAPLQDAALTSGEPQRYSAIVFVGGWGSSMYQYAYSDPGIYRTSDGSLASLPADAGSHSELSVVKLLD